MTLSCPVHLARHSRVFSAFVETARSRLDVSRMRLRIAENSPAGSNVRRNNFPWRTIAVFETSATAGNRTRHPPYPAHYDSQQCCVTDSATLLETMESDRTCQALVVSNSGTPRKTGRLFRHTQPGVLTIRRQETGIGLPHRLHCGACDSAHRSIGPCFLTPERSQEPCAC